MISLKKIKAGIGKNKVIIKPPIFNDNIDDLEREIGWILKWYGLIIVFIILLTILLQFLLNKYTVDYKLDIATTVTCFFVAAGGWAALKTWQVSLIFNLKQDRRSMTMQQMLNHQQSDIYIKSKKIIRKFYPDCVNAMDTKPIPLISDITIISEEQSKNGKEGLTKAEVESIENAFESIMNSYEYLAAAIIEGYVDESYLKETIRGQLIRACELFCLNIRAANSENKKTLQHVIEIYDLWYDQKLDGTKHHIRG